MFLSKLPDSGSGTMVGVLTAAGVYLIYNNALPTTADVQASPANDATIEQCRKKAAWESLALVGVVFLVARDLNSYIISGAALVGMDLLYKHSNAVHPATGKVDKSSDATSIDSDSPNAAVYSLPEYGTAGE